MNNNLLILVIFWGVWIIIPILFDGVLTFIYMLVIIIKKPGIRKHDLDPLKLPKVSIIIPTYNEEENINECLNYLKIQTYPHHRMEIIVVDNGSTDRTNEIVKKHLEDLKTNNGGDNNINGKIKVNGNSYEANSFGGILKLVVREEKGKAKALNAGIRLAQGDIIINIDCRSFLAPDAVYNMVAKFIEHPEYGAATGNVEIDWNLLYKKNIDGKYILDKDDHYQPRKLTRKEKFLAKAQFMEYLTSFRIGREFQDITGSMYTFSGAFSAFRREVLMNSSLYRDRTVSEDTDLTLDLQGQNLRLGFTEDAKAFLKPVISFEKLYAQRLRWHRGQIEVVGLHLDWYANLTRGFWRNFWLGLLLMMDHSFSFPRIVWMFLLPLFFLFGYSTNLIIQAIILMYGFYVFMDFLNVSYSYRVSDFETRAKIKECIQYCFVMPFYRIIAFFFRFAGYLEVIKEPPAWSAPINIVRTMKGYRGTIFDGYQKTAGFRNKIIQLITGRKPEPKVYDDEKISELDSYGLERNGGHKIPEEEPNSKTKENNKN